jgi:hypothetical protein
MTNAKYLRTFKSLVDSINHLSCNIGTDQAIIAERVIADEGNVDDPATWAAIKIRVQEEYLAICCFLQSNPKCFGALIANAQNDFVGGGVNNYPKDLHKAGRQHARELSEPWQGLPASYNQDSGMSFYQRMFSAVAPVVAVVVVTAVEVDVDAAMAVHI